MWSKIRQRLTYANVVATLALFVALGGVGYASGVVPRNSVGNKELKRNAVTSAKVKNGSLDVVDIKPSARATLRGARGQQGAQGPQGPQGAQGATGAAGSARAYASVEADNGVPAVFIGAHPGFTSVSRTATGVYCLIGDPGLTADQLTSALVAAHNVGAAYHVGASVCTGGVEVWTRDTANATADFIDFNVLVP